MKEQTKLPSIPLVPKASDADSDWPPIPSEPSVASSPPGFSSRSRDKPLPNELRPDYGLWVSLVGGDGVWKQRQAKEEWGKQLVEHAECVRQQTLAEERRREKLAKDADKARRKQEEELLAVQAREERERQRKLEEETLRKEREEEKRRKKLEEERERLRYVPKACEVCAGSGRCRTCKGEGTLQTYYLAPTVTGANGAAGYGCRPRGCEACGGLPIEWGDFSGSGKCEGCNGAKMLNPPPGGWPK